jgi:hypothetical protein
MKRNMIVIKFCSRCDDAITETNDSNLIIGNMTTDTTRQKFGDLDCMKLCDTCANSLLDWFHSSKTGPVKFDGITDACENCTSIHNVSAGLYPGISHRLCAGCNCPFHNIPE